MEPKKETQAADAAAAAVTGVMPKKSAPLAPASNPKGRVRVAKAYKMYVGGAFVRSESGRYFQVKSDAGSQDPRQGGGPDPETVNIPRGSRKDVRDAVLVAKNAQDGWAARTAYNRGQILYRLAEVMESRRDELVMSLVRGGLAAEEAEREADSAIDRSVYYAGFADKISALVASHNPVSGPHFGFSLPEPLGIVCVIAPPRPALLGLVSTVLPTITSGNTCVVLASETDPRTAIVFGECLATSDLPGGVVNILTGHAHELASHMARHREVFGMDAWVDDAKLAADVEKAGADNVKRVKTHPCPAPEAWQDDATAQGIGWIERFLEIKTVWHPVGV
jgi:acyl-CoA reductase-like NAD-dependent aldehyde dehydrogenase